MSGASATSSNVPPSCSTDTRTRSRICTRAWTSPSGIEGRIGKLFSPRRRARIVTAGAWAFGLAPLALLIRRFLGELGLGANPIKALIIHFGTSGLVLLIATLSITPLRRLTGFNPLVRARRPLGVFAFVYVMLHFLSYLVLDQFFAWNYIAEDILERPFITVGFLAFLMLIPLALTSTRGWIRRLGRNWTRLHRLVYPAAVLGLIHYYWNVRGDEFDPWVYATVLAAALAARIPIAMRARARRKNSRPERKARRNVA